MAATAILDFENLKHLTTDTVDTDGECASTQNFIEIGQVVTERGVVNRQVGAHQMYSVFSAFSCSLLLLVHCIRQSSKKAIIKINATL